MCRVFLATLLLGIALSGCGNARAIGTTPAVPPPAPDAVTPIVPPAERQRACPVCGQIVPADAKYCLRCGSRLP